MAIARTPPHLENICTLSKLTQARISCCQVFNRSAIKHGVLLHVHKTFLTQLITRRDTRMTCVQSLRAQVMFLRHHLALSLFVTISTNYCCHASELQPWGLWIFMWRCFKMLVVHAGKSDNLPLIQMRKYEHRSESKHKRNI